MVPRDAQSTDAFQKIYDVYGAGVLYPFQLVISSANANDEITQEKFQDLLAGLNEAVPKGRVRQIGPSEFFSYRPRESPLSVNINNVSEAVHSRHNILHMCGTLMAQPTWPKHARRSV